MAPHSRSPQVQQGFAESHARAESLDSPPEQARAYHCRPQCVGSPREKDAAERHITSRSAGDRSVLSIAKVAVAKARQDSPGGWQEQGSLPAFSGKRASGLE